jgi:tetratricopeptide (TPR) repeat protein
VVAEANPRNLPVFDPQTWIDLLTVATLKNDLFSARTLMVIQEGIEKLGKAADAPGTILAITEVHAKLFERLRQSFNNPNLLKEVGVAYLEQFRLPDSALKHFDLARQFAPTDRDLERLQVAAALAIARDVTDKAGHSGIDEAEPPKSEMNAVLRKTSKLVHVADAREHLDESADKLGRRQEDLRKTASLSGTAAMAASDYHLALARAQGFLVHADFAGAAAALEEARREGAPKEELQAAHAQAGLAAYDAERLDAALDAFERVRDLGPESVEGWFNCGLVYQKIGRFDDALASYREAIKLAPENTKTWCNLSSVWFERGNPEESEKAARECLRLKPDYARAWDNLASALGALGRLSEAAEACQHAIRIQPGLHSAWFKYGVINYQLDNMFVAAEAFNVAEASPAFHAYVVYYMAMIAARRGELETAMEKLQEARVADANNELETATVKEIAAAYTKDGDHERAADLFSQITKKYPEDFSGWLGLGTALHRAERYEGARGAYLRATELRPESPIAWHNLGLLASDQGKHEEARVHFQREVELAPDDAKAWYDLGVALQKLGREDESSDAFEHSESLVKSLSRRSSDLSAALSIVRRLNLTGRMLKTE